MKQTHYLVVNVLTEFIPGDKDTPKSKTITIINGQELNISYEFDATYKLMEKYNILVDQIVEKFPDLVIFSSDQRNVLNCRMFRERCISDRSDELMFVDYDYADKINITINDAICSSSGKINRI